MSFFWMGVLALSGGMLFLDAKPGVVLRIGFKNIAIAPNGAAALAALVEPCQRKYYFNIDIGDGT